MTEPVEPPESLVVGYGYTGNFYTEIYAMDEITITRYCAGDLLAPACTAINEV
jgi:hypothetical protein